MINLVSEAGRSVLDYRLMCPPGFGNEVNHES